ncbi:pre-rRNA-processing protein IPI1 [Sesbania bispinosa]|nr:pre-rRNA-processing protein IPI1 [Sesbania bispinosa]
MKVKAGEEGEEGLEQIYSFPTGGSKIINLLTSGNRLRTRFLNGISDSGERMTEEQTYEAKFQQQRKWMKIEEIREEGYVLEEGGSGINGRIAIENTETEGEAGGKDEG